MPRGKKTDPETEEAIRADYAVTQNLATTAKKFGVSSQTVMKIRDADPDEFEELRSYKKQEFIADAWSVISSGMSMLPTKFIEASARDISTSIGIIVDKMQLLQGEPTSRSENANKNMHSIDDVTPEQAKMIVDMFMKEHNG